MGKMVILPTTKEPGQEAAFTMEIHGDAAFTLEEISQEHDWHKVEGESNTVPLPTQRAHYHS